MPGQRSHWGHRHRRELAIRFAAMLVGDASPSMTQTDPPRRQRIAPRVFPRSLQAEKKSCVAGIGRLTTRTQGDKRHGLRRQKARSHFGRSDCH
jgi:hypothetical protein